MARTPVMMLGTIPAGGSQSLPSTMLDAGMQPNPQWRTSFLTTATTVPSMPQNIVRNSYAGPPYTMSSVGVPVVPLELRALGKLGAAGDESVSWFDEQRAKYNAMVAASDPAYVKLSQTTISVLAGSMRLMGAAVGGYHGYKRNSKSAGWAAAWAASGFLFPLVTVGVGLAQGLAQKK